MNSYATEDFLTAVSSRHWRLLASALQRQRPTVMSIRCRARSISLTPDHKEATIKHEDIKGFMSAMTMPYKVRDAKEYADLEPGDLINATLVIVSNDAYLKDVKKVGNAPLEKPPADAPRRQRRPVSSC